MPRDTQSLVGRIIAHVEQAIRARDPALADLLNYDAIASQEDRIPVLVVAVHPSVPNKYRGVPKIGERNTIAGFTLVWDGESQSADNYLKFETANEIIIDAVSTLEGPIIGMLNMNISIDPAQSEIGYDFETDRYTATFLAEIQFVRPA